MMLMLDFETLGVTPDAMVLSLGAILFEKEIVKEKGWFFKHSTINKDVQPNRKFDQQTIAWWHKQKPQAQKIFEYCQSIGVTLPEFIQDFRKWLPESCQTLTVWGNGATFDVAIIEDIFRSLNEPIPWRFTNVRCYRTIKAIHRIEAGRAFEGIPHQAIDDARYQAKCLMNWFSTR